MRSQGFTLIEALVAVAILSMSTYMLSNIVRSHATAAASLDSYYVASMMASSEMERALSLPINNQGVTERNDGPALHYQYSSEISIQPTDIDDLYAILVKVDLASSPGDILHSITLRSARYAPDDI